MRDFYEEKRKMSVLKLGAKNPNWKGGVAKKRMAHEWMYKSFGKAWRCEKCNRTEKDTDNSTGKKFHWSNKNHKYEKVREEWQMLCAKCHSKYDFKHNKNKSQPSNT